MHKFTKIGLAISAVALLAIPAVGLAKSNNSHKTIKALTSPSSIEKSDANTIGRFNRSQAHKKYRTVVGKVSATTASSITVDVTTKAVTNANGNTNTSWVTKSYTFTIDSSTLIIRKFKGKATWNEIAVGDSVWVRADKLADGKAKLIWDKSIWWVGYKGTISNLNTTTKSFDLTVTVRKIDYKVSVKWDDFTEFTDAAGVKTSADLLNGQTITIRGSWNRVGKYILSKKINILVQPS